MRKGIAYKKAKDYENAYKKPAEVKISVHAWWLTDFQSGMILVVIMLPE